MSYEDLKSRGSFDEVTRSRPSSRPGNQPESIAASRNRWAEENLPDQYVGAVVLAFHRLRREGVEPTKERIVAWLKANGWWQEPTKGTA